MAKVSLQQDVHGLYLWHQGSLYRPQQSAYCRGYSAQQESLYEAGQQASVTKCRHAPLCRVSRPGGSLEYWADHTNHQSIESAQSWAPVTPEPRPAED